MRDWGGAGDRGGAGDGGGGSHIGVVGRSSHIGENYCPYVVLVVGCIVRGRSSCVRVSTPAQQ